MRIFKIVILILVLFVALVTSSVLTNAMSLPPIVNTILTGVIVGFAFLMLVAMVIFVLTLDNAMAGVSYYLLPDFSKIDAGVINGALSQAFFSLSLSRSSWQVSRLYLRVTTGPSNVLAATP